MFQLDRTPLNAIVGIAAIIYKIYLVAAIRNLVKGLCAKTTK